MDVVRNLILGVIVGSGLAAFGRGESWVVKQQPAPPLSTLTNEARYIEWKFREDVTDPSTGLDAKALRARVVAMSKELEPKEAWCVVKARCYAALCDEMAIDVSSLDWFPAISIWNRYDRPLRPVVDGRNARIGAKYHAAANRMIDANNRSGVWMTWKDFDHSVPVWEELIAAGFPGVRAQVAACDDGRDFYKALAITADATLRLIDRFAALGQKRLAAARERGDRIGALRLEGEVASLLRLRQGPPQTAYDVLNFIWLYFFCCEHLDVMQCRSLTIIDRTLWPYYRRDLAAGRTTEAEFREQFRHWLWQWGSVDNYWGQPITMGGSKKDGSTEYNPLSFVILDVMDQCALTTPKFHVKIAKNTPVAILNRLLDMARRHRSLSFIGEEPVKKMLMSRGYTADEVQGFYTKGCYEVCVPNGANGTGTGYINLLKQVELTLAETKNAPAVAARYPTYSDFEAECIRRMAAICRDCMTCASSFEKHLDDVNPANVSTLGVRHAIRVGKDAFSTGSERGNCTDIQISALGTTVDALVAVDEIVYERKLMSLGELAALMAVNWKGGEELQLRMRRSPRKWGNNDPKANAVAVRLQNALSDTVNGQPNARGGVYGLCGHTARAFIYSGEKTGATPDGRRAGEEFSKNLSPQPGADTEGMTALVQSLGALDSRKWPGDFPLDVMLHSSAVAGNRGLEMMRTMLSVYFENGGLMMQFIVTSPEELRDAQRHPERYENLQIRVCGWNVRWNDIPKAEQDAYILRAENIAQD